jgi:aryl-alcohol dehydrogenase-like predicted oxidoreductase
VAQKRGRDGLVIATKIAGPGRRDWIRNGRTDITRDTIAEAVGTSLARLNLDRSTSTRSTGRSGTSRSSARPSSTRRRSAPGRRSRSRSAAWRHDRGRKIRYWGLSNETAWGVAAFARAARELGVPGPVTTQNSCNLVSRAVEGDLAEAIYRENMSVLPYSPLAGGMLTGKYRGDAKPPGRATRCSTRSAAATASRWCSRPATPTSSGQAPRAHIGAAGAGWLRTRWYVGATILGATSVAQLDEDIDASQTRARRRPLADIAQVQLRYRTRPV